jgi:hypothetical protein
MANEWRADAGSCIGLPPFDVNMTRHWSKPESPRIDLRTLIGSGFSSRLHMRPLQASSR